MLPEYLIKILVANDFFNGVTTEQMHLLQKEFFEAKSFSAGDQLIEKGKVASNMFLIVKGCVQVHKTFGEKESVEIIKRYPGDLIGEMGLIENKTRSTNVVAETDIELLFISKKNFYKILNIIPETKNNMMRKITSRLRESDARTITLINRYHTLIELNREIMQQKQDLQNLNHELEIKNQALYKAAITDPLTGIFNRSYMMGMLGKEFHNSIRYENPLSCILMDLDHFKAINDNYGHQAGDYVLGEVASLVQKNIRLGDVFCRFGGEEFLLVLPHTNLQNSQLVGEKLRKLIEKYKFSYEEQDIQITLSLGITDNKMGTPKTEEEMLKYADQALYLAKEGGRNRAVVYQVTL
ncbi:MAG: GGDEF domain-containing protein [Spirochaetota bacterium]